MNVWHKRLIDYLTNQFNTTLNHLIGNISQIMSCIQSCYHCVLMCSTWASGLMYSSAGEYHFNAWNYKICVMLSIMSMIACFPFGQISTTQLWNSVCQSTWILSCRSFLLSAMDGKPLLSAAVSNNSNVNVSSLCRLIFIQCRNKWKAVVHWK